MLQGIVRFPQSTHVIDVVQQRCETSLPILPCCLTDPLQRAGQTGLAQSPGFVALGRVSLGPIPSLRHLRCVVVRFVRRLLRYYGSVRLPMIVHHRRSSLDFPMRSAFADNHGISQFPSKMFPCMPGVLDLAGSSCNIGIRCSRCCLPRSITPSAPRSFEQFRGSIPCLHVPLSTSRLHPYGCLRMTRGQRGLPDLHCRTLSFLTSWWLKLVTLLIARPPLLLRLRATALALRRGDARRGMAAPKHSDIFSLVRTRSPPGSDSF